MYLLFGEVCFSLFFFFTLPPKPLITHTEHSKLNMEGKNIRDSGVNAIESLMARRGAFDYILLETTGLANPGNIAPLFWVDEGLGSTIYLDGIVTLVDAKNILKSLDETEGNTTTATTATTAHLQISHADVIVINKTDLVSGQELDNVRARIRGINGLARICESHHGRVTHLEGVVLDLHAYDKVDSLPDVQQQKTQQSVGSSLDPTISTLTLQLPILTQPQTQFEKLDSWLRSVLWTSTLPLPSSPSSFSTSNDKNDDDKGKGGFEIHRLKGLIYHLIFEDENEINVDIDNASRQRPSKRLAKKFIQGVRDVFEIFDDPNPNADSDSGSKFLSSSSSFSKRKEHDRGDGGNGGHEQKEGKIVLIGRGLDLGVEREGERKRGRDLWQRSLDWTVLHS